MTSQHKPALPLPGGLRRDMEDSLGADLSAVILDDAPCVRAALCAAGMLARATPDRIALGFPATLLDTRPGRRVLAHELAHILQFRAGGTAAPTAALEAEADEVAACIAAGGAARIRLRAAPGIGLAWGEVGHYYTTYYVMLAAGMDPETAFRVAFFAQFPDEVEELDAVERGISWALGRLFGPLMLVNGGPGNPMPPSPDQVKMYTEQQRQNEDQLHIQRGLHGLNGTNAEAETKRRTAILEAIDPMSGDFAFEFGLAVHPFGDSFAHRKGNMMYHTGFGHAEDFHAPDVVSNARAKLYVAYVDALYAIAVKKARGAPRGGGGSPSDLLARITPIGSALNVPMPMQSNWIREWSASRLGVPLKGYDPLKYDLLPFAEFIKQPHAILAGVRQDHFTKAVALSRKWAG